jgi:hypothetical protein
MTVAAQLYFYTKELIVSDETAVVLAYVCWPRLFISLAWANMLNTGFNDRKL